MSLVHQNWWFTTLLIKQFKYCPPLSKSLKCDVLIVGGGVSGISAAAEFVKQGRSVVLIRSSAGNYFHELGLCGIEFGFFQLTTDAKDAKAIIMLFEIGTDGCIWFWSFCGR